jgi:hypothetical protein
MLSENTLEYYSLEELKEALTNLGYVGHNNFTDKHNLIIYIKCLINNK